jgi:hypothetical protein
LLPLFATGVNDNGGKFADGVVDTGGNLSPALLTPVANLTPVSTTLVKMVYKFAAGVADTGGKFATGVVDNGGNFAAGVVGTGGAPWLANISANFRKNLKQSKRNTLGWGVNWFMIPLGDTRSAKIIRRFDPPFRMAKIRGEGGVICGLI